MIDHEKAKELAKDFYARYSPNDSKNWPLINLALAYLELSNKPPQTGTKTYGYKDDQTKWYTERLTTMDMEASMSGIRKIE